MDINPLLRIILMVNKWGGYARVHVNSLKHPGVNHHIDYQGEDKSFS